MKKIIVVFFYIFLLSSCNKKSKTEIAVQEIAINIKVERFDKLFFETNPKDLYSLKSKFSFLFPSQTPDSVWLNKMKNPMWRELYGEVQKKYPDIEPLKIEVESLVKHIKYYYPETKNPKIVTLISEMDYKSKSIYADTLILVPLELYLGKNHKFYENEFPDYIKQNFEQNQIIQDIASSFADLKIGFPKEKTLLAQMIYQGKKLYLKDKIIPETTDEDKIGYTKEQLLFCKENESYMWSNFIENQYLFSSDSKLPNRFVNDAPFSKFYLEIDNETPGRVGAWLGWQILRSYAENNDTKLQDLMKLDAKTIFDKSRYKPVK